MSPVITANLEALGDTSDQILDVRDNGLKMENMRQCNQTEKPTRDCVALQKIPKARSKREGIFNAYSIITKGRTCTPAACLLVEKNFSAVKVLLPSSLVVCDTCERQRAAQEHAVKKRECTKLISISRCLKSLSREPRGPLIVTRRDFTVMPTETARINQKKKFSMRVAGIFAGDKDIEAWMRAGANMIAKRKGSLTLFRDGEGFLGGN
jgi:hypothetical protein